VKRAAGLGLMVIAMLLPPATAAAQDSFAGVLSFLLTNRAVQTDDFVRDAESAAATRDAVTRLLGAELATQPPSLSSAGFAYRYNRELGTMERASASFGSFFTERSLTGGQGQAAIGVNVRFSRYTHLDGRDLRDGRFRTTANQFRDEPAPFDEETLTLELESRVLTVTGSYGLTERLDVSAAIPFVELSMAGSRVNTYRGRSTTQAEAEATSRGFGDIAVRGKYGLFVAPTGGVAIAGEVRLPTGSEANLLGTGRTAFSALIIGSAERGPLGWSGNVSLGGGGFSNELGYRGAMSLAATDRLTLIGEVVGRRFGDAGLVVEARASHPNFNNVETIRLVADDSTATTAAAVFGAKWNLSGTWILAGHAMLPMSNRGLRSGVVTLIGLDYAFTPY
jgi:hypothetical protein